MTRKQFSGLLFHRDTLMLPFIVFSIWASVSLILDSTADEKDLDAHRGILTNIDSVITRIKDKPLFKETTRELRLTINSENGYYTTVTTTHFGTIVSELKLSDSVVIYTRSKRWGIFDLKKEREISQLVKADKIIISYEKYKRSIAGLYIPLLLLSAVLLIVFWHRTTRRYNMYIRAYPPN